MSAFEEDQRIVIRALAAEEAQRVQRESESARLEQIKSEVSRGVEARLPRLSKFEKLISTVGGLVAVLVALPLVPAAATLLGKEVLDSGLATKVQAEIDKEDGPVRKKLKRFDAFNGTLSDQFAKSVDSATAKLLRFGCNPPGAFREEGFASCTPTLPAPGQLSSGQARDVLEANEQTIIFKANKESQRVLLQLRLFPIDGVDVLSRVGLRLQTPNLFSTEQSGAQHGVRLAKSDLPGSDDFVHHAGLLKLYGGVAEVGDRQALQADVDITEHLRKNVQLHSLRFRVEPLEGGASGSHRGSERFFVQAVVIVTHTLKPPKE